jgi:hypothetical protein
MSLGKRITGSFIFNEMAVNRGLEVPGFLIGNKAKINNLHHPSCLIRHKAKIQVLPQAKVITLGSP